MRRYEIERAWELDPACMYHGWRRKRSAKREEKNVVLYLLFKWKLILRERLERFHMAVVWRLPRKWVYWSTIRLSAFVTTGDYGQTDVPELTVMDALQRWEKA